MVLFFGTVSPWLLIAVGAWLGYQLVRQNGRILLRLEGIEKQLGPRGGTKPRTPADSPGGLPVGGAAPDFELPDLAGVRHKLSEFRGNDLLLIFFNPKCGFYSKMAEDLASLPIDGTNGRPIPLVVTTGDVEENRRLIEQFGIRGPVLLQEQMEVAHQLRAQGTPMGYRIDAQGRIASELTVGAEPLLELASLKASQLHKIEGTGNGSASHGKQVDPSLARSRLNRNGLKAGTTAPDFRLPRLDDGELSLSDLQGRCVLLVFSDPNCGPCDELAPQLEKIHQERSEIQVLIVSRRDAEATRAKATKLGLSFPVVMQDQWEISLKYAMFATPIGYLIDGQGIILKDVAVGVGPILALAAELSARPLEPVNTLFVTEVTS